MIYQLRPALVPLLDTATVTVIPEVPEHSFYLMQWLRIGGNNQLIIFDRGANTHLVQGKMAVAAGFEITSSRPMSLTVVGGENLKTEYGSYRFNLLQRTPKKTLESKFKKTKKIRQKN